MNIAAQKEELRQYFRALRNSLTVEQVTKKSQEINQNFIRNLLPKLMQKNVRQNFALYLQSGKEVGTGHLAAYLEQRGIAFSYPRISGNNLEFVLAQANQMFEPNVRYASVFEPSGGKKIIPQIIIMPLVAFDAKCVRLGMGGGFYDRTLEMFKRRNHKFITVAFAYESQRATHDLPCDKLDWRPDFVVTEKNIFVASPVL